MKFPDIEWWPELRLKHCGYYKGLILKLYGYSCSIRLTVNNFEK